MTTQLRTKRSVSSLQQVQSTMRGRTSGRCVAVRWGSSSEWSEEVVSVPMVSELTIVDPTALFVEECPNMHVSVDLDSELSLTVKLEDAFGLAVTGMGGCAFVHMVRAKHRSWRDQAQRWELGSTLLFWTAKSGSISMDIRCASCSPRRHWNRGST